MITRSTSVAHAPKPRADSPQFALWLRETMTADEFEGLPQDDVEALRRFATRSTYPPGKTLFRQGDWPQELLIIERGSRCRAP